MMQVIYHRYTDATAEYTYKLRNRDLDEITPVMRDEIDKGLDQLCDLRFQPIEINYLRSLGFFKEDFLEFLEHFQLRRKHIYFNLHNFELTFQGSWLNIMMFETFTMTLISEVFFKHHPADETVAQDRLQEKIRIIKEHNKECANNPLFKFADFGGRRRYSLKWHRYMLQMLMTHVPHNLVGTSNVMLARELDLTPIGTMAHEYLQAFQALGPRLIDSQKEALQTWADEYRGKLGIALTDVITMDAFLNDFDLYFCKLFDGCRHDSGDPVEWCEKLIKHYENLGIDPRTKTVVFSDGLTMEKAIALFKKFRNRINVSFGIGTHLTNDFGVPAMNHVIKMIRCNGQSVAKISDSEGKTLCKDKEYINYLKQVFGVK
jgi:nicotinate phosphoribosyltransferase